MTEVFGEDGKNYPATILSVPTTTVTLLRTIEKDGCNAVQIGFGDKKKGFREYRPATGDKVPTVGDKIDASIFQTGELVTVSAISKGKGFQGVVKRHGFHGGPRTHGQKHSERGQLAAALEPAAGWQRACGWLAGWAVIGLP